MRNGFAGTSIDDILKSAGLTKGAFFHHFKGKADLARELVEWHARRDLAMFEGFAAEAAARSDDPLEQAMVFLEAFEDYVTPSSDRSPGCMYAVYTYESMQFDPVGPRYRRRCPASVDVDICAPVPGRDRPSPPALPVTARQLAETIVSIIEGGLVLQRAYGDAGLTARQSEQFRNYLTLLFTRNDDRPARKKPAAGKRRARVTEDA